MGDWGREGAVSPVGVRAAGQVGAGSLWGVAGVQGGGDGGSGWGPWKQSLEVCLPRVCWLVLEVLGLGNISVHQFKFKNLMISVLSV